jgi:hypothetical protein
MDGSREISLRLKAGARRRSRGPRLGCVNSVVPRKRESNATMHDSRRVLEPRLDSRLRWNDVTVEFGIVGRETEHRSIQVLLKDEGPRFL